MILERIDMKLEALSKKIRRHVIKMIANAGSGHPGGSLSCTDILVTLYFDHMNYRIENPEWEERDRFILSKGHAAPALYATLAEVGFFPVEELQTLRKLNSRLQGHPNRLTPGVEIATGSLGQGLSIGNGIALTAKLDGRGYKVYVLLGDGEINEGQVWEAAMTASHYKLDNLTAIIDKNGFQLDGPTKKIMNTEPMAKKWQAFGWHVIEIDGHDFNEIKSALREEVEKPKVIIANTIKGKGVSFMENNNYFHGKAPTKEEEKRALKELV